ncbi:MAG TPA: ABC transporter ATP-binding protein [Gemmatimonadales bacterium]|jgi:ATP-binding cassette subfamily B protein
MTAATQPNIPQRPQRPYGRSAEKPSWKERFEALKNVPPLLRMVWNTHHVFAALILALRVLRALIPLAILWIGKLIIDGVVGSIQAYAAGHAVPWQHLFQLVCIELGLAIVSEATARAGSLIESLLGDLFSNVVSVRLMEHASTLDLKQFEDPEFYDHLERARRQTVGRIGLIAIILGTAQSLITLLSLTAALVLYVPWLLILLVIAVLPSFIGETHYATLGYSLLYRWTPERRMLDYLRFTGASDETAKEIKLFGLSDWLVERYAKLADEFYEANAKLAIRHGIVAWLLATFGALGYYGAYVWIIVLTVKGHHSAAGLFTLGVLTFLAASFRQSRDLIQSVLLNTSQLYEQALYLRDLFTFFDMKPAIASKAGARTVPRPIARGFEFQDVGFRYPGGDKWAVRHLSFKIEPGERLALVGENGAGKTTLVKLLARLYDPDEGTILLDGTDLREYDVTSLHRAIGVIFQDFVRYNFLFRENIGVGEIGAVGDPARITTAAQRSLAADVAGRMKGGYEQQLGRRFDGGVDLSGGEWQKVALARAYLRDADVLILDEPTAALDARAEFQVFQRFTELTKGKMAVLISHRFSTVRMADRILVLDKGLIVEQGTHAELVARRGTYAELFELQAAGYK